METMSALTANAVSADIVFRTIDNQYIVLCDKIMVNQPQYIDMRALRSYNYLMKVVKEQTAIDLNR